MSQIFKKGIFSGTKLITDYDSYLKVFANALWAGSESDPDLKNDLIVHYEGVALNCARESITQKPIPYIEYLNDYINSLLLSDISELEALISSYLIENGKLPTGFVNDAFRSAELLIEKVKELPHLKPHQFVISKIESFCDEFKIRFNINQVNSDIKPLVWAGGVSLLGTLFSDLKFGRYLENKHPLITSDVADIVRALQVIFVDQDGSKFEKSSLQKYVYKNFKTAKKNRVEISDTGKIKGAK